MQFIDLGHRSNLIGKKINRTGTEHRMNVLFVCQLMSKKSLQRYRNTAPICCSRRQRAYPLARIVTAISDGNNSKKRMISSLVVLAASEPVIFRIFAIC
jgi:hypothetical protein